MKKITLMDVDELEIEITYEAGHKKAKKDFERPHGEWIESKERKGHFYCSECVQQDVSGKWRELFDYKYNFCPNCGSDNRGTEK